MEKEEDIGEAPAGSCFAALVPRDTVLWSGVGQVGFVEV